MASSVQNHYATLGVARDASAENIKRAYYAAARRFHPDQNTLPGETEMFLEVQKAYEVLSNAERRALYDATLPPEQSHAKAPVQISVKYSRANLVHLNEPQLLYALLEISAPHSGDSIQATPLNACLVLDISTSMQGPKMDLVKASAIRLLRMLRPEDRFGLVLFSDRAQVLLSSGHPRELNAAESRIQSIRASGATELLRGLQSGLSEVRRGMEPGRGNHLILLTDGHTYGDEQGCLQLAEEAARLNVSISGFGIGPDWNDLFLDSLAGRTGGSSTYASTPNEIQTVLLEKFSSLSQTVVDAATIDYRQNPGVELRYCYRLQPQAGRIEIGNTLHLGSVLRETALGVIFEFEVAPSASKTDTVTLLDGSVFTVARARPTPMPPIRLNMRVPSLDTASPEPPPQTLLAALSRLSLYRLQERARHEADAGEFDSATRHLRNLAIQLEAQGHSALAKTAALEAESLERIRAYSSEGGKQIKFGTRALLGPVLETGK